VGTTHSSTGYMSLSNASTVFASSDRSQTGRPFSAPGCGNENMVSKIGDAIDRIVLWALNSTTLGPLDRRIMSAVGELSKSCGIVERERYKGVTAAGVWGKIRLLSVSMVADDIKSLYDKQGYVIVPALIPAELDQPVREATERVIARTRSGEWPHRRTVGKQFPPFDNDNPDSWGVQHLMHPDLGKPIFAQWYTSGPLVQTTCRLLDCGDDKLQMGVLLKDPGAYSS